MKKQRFWAVVLDCLHKNRIGLILYAVTLSVFAVVFALYGVFSEPLIYAAVLCSAAWLVALVIDCVKAFYDAQKRDRVLSSVLTERNDLPKAQSLGERDYQQMIFDLGRQIDTLLQELTRQKTDMNDYYTTWVHQIKTPLSVIKMTLDENSDRDRQLSAELFRIEQYVNMALQYIRLDCDTNDLVVTDWDTDDLVRETLRKLAPQFILQKIRLNFIPSGKHIITDKKWFVCILEQLITNAVKYTPSGTVTVYSDEDGLHVSDTGIGIAPEDLTRIFEKGYTGINGRLNSHSSGLGLYLAKSAADKLALTLSVKSTQGKGSTFSIRFPLDKRISY